jgi:hypothetical protein
MMSKGYRAANRTGFLGMVVVVAVLCAYVGVAHAESSWWQVTSTPTPSIIRPGDGHDEVQQLAVSAEGGQFVLLEPGDFEFAFFKWDATPEEVQTGLEGLYGKGNVEVTGGPGDAGARKPYVITFVGALADHEVPLIEGAYSPSFLEGGRKEAVVTELTPGSSDGELVLAVTNLGDGTVHAAGSPVTITDKLPPGLTAIGIAGGDSHDNYLVNKTLSCSLSSLSCTFEGVLAPYEQLEIVINVSAQAGASEQLENEVLVSGGNTPPVNVRRPLTVGSAQTPFGVENYELYPANEDGSPATQAGSHPFQLTTTLDLDTKLEPVWWPFGKRFLTEVHPAALVKDLHFNIPPGLIGDPTPLPQCSDAQFSVPEKGQGNSAYNNCPANTAIGVATVVVSNALSQETMPEVITVPLFNLVPSHGEPARFGFSPLVGSVTLDTYVRTGGDYGVVVHVDNITQLVGFMASEVTFWGVPGDPRHNQSRGTECLEGSFAGAAPCTSGGEEHPSPFVILPTSCTGPLQTSIEADSWANPGVFTSKGYTFQSIQGEPLGMDGCNRLSFEPSISLTPDGQSGSTPTGLTVGVHVPQTASLNPTGDAESTVKDTTVALPVGVGLNPTAADGLSSCGLGEIGLESAVEQTCPESSKVGTVEIRTPLLPNPLVGAAYLAQQDANPFGSLIALYLVVRDPISGVLVKLAGQVTPDPVTGQLVSTFKETPQLPFEDLSLHFFGGSRAPLGTPALCGGYTTRASIAPWSGNAPVESSSEFRITSGPNDSPCSNPLPFDPSLTTGSLNIQAGAFTPFTMTMSREDGNQNLDAIQLKMPPGLLGTLSSVKLCGEAEGNAGTCGPESLIGHTTVSVGLGGNPYTVTGGEVFITGPYDGAPYGLSIVNPAKAGPFDLGKVVVRAKIEVNPENAALTITSDSTGPYAIPQILDGIPLEIKHVNVSIDRPDFTFNPTNCAPQQIGGGLTSSQGAFSALHVPFQVTNCAVLAFKPIFSVSTNGKTSRAKGASLNVKLTYPKAAFGTQANIGKVKVDLPKQLPSRLTTLQKACPDSVFNANPASCPADSRIGSATATTPVLPVHLEGPAYFVSHGGAKFPELIVALSGEGVTVYLHGETFISPAGITSSTFRTIPDVPIGTFELKLPQGPDSALAANGNLCTSKLVMPTTFVGANGVSLKQSTPITVTGCPKHKTKTKKAKKKSKHKKKGK